MNYYNLFPYTNPMYYQAPIIPARTSLLRSLFPLNINFRSILNGAQRTINLVNQTIPLIEQAKPMVNNAKTMFKVMKEFKKINTPGKSIIKKEEPKLETEVTKEPTNSLVGPTFFQ